MDDNRDFYTTDDVGKALGVSYGKARLIVKDEADVLDFGTPKKAMRRIPREVYLRIIKRAAAPIRPCNVARHLAEQKKAG